ncbi:MAG: hypothetical protein HY062_15850 [Bacteroidetes bacterium]|nr:hypothetical protein [Bacteroidota bacterium]
MRIFIPHKSNPLLNGYVIKNKLVDYMTGATSGGYAVREVTELLIGLNGNFDETITHRKNFSSEYSYYLAQRKSTNPSYFTITDGEMVESKQ